VQHLTMTGLKAVEFTLLATHSVKSTEQYYSTGKVMAFALAKLS